MKIKDVDVRKAYIDKNGNVKIKNFTFVMKLIDPTCIMPHLTGEKWGVYSPYDCDIVLKKDYSVAMKLGIAFKCPPGFVIYFFVSALYDSKIKVKEKIVLPGDHDEVELVITAREDFNFTKYLNLAEFVILPILNDE